MISKIAQLMVCALLAALFTGCSSTRLIYQDKSFSRESLKGGKLVFGAVTALGGGEYIAADELCEVVQKQFQARRPWLETLPLASARSQFPAGEYEAFLKRVSENGRWSETDMERFHSLSNVARYVLIIDVVKANEVRIDSMVSRYNFEPTYMTGPYDYDIVRGGRRSVRAVFMLRDLQLGKTVWIASGAAAASARRSQPAFLSMYNSSDGPGIPSVVEVMDTIAKRTSKKLP